MNQEVSRMSKDRTAMKSRKAQMRFPWRYRDVYERRLFKSDCLTQSCVELNDA